MELIILTIAVGVGLAFWLSRIFFSPEGELPDPCKDKLDEAVEAAERYEEIRRNVIELINEKARLEEEIEDLEPRKRRCDEELERLRKEFNEGGVVLADDVGPEWEEERRRLREALQAKQAECDELDEELDSKRRRLRDVSSRLRAGSILEQVGRETYPDKYREYWDCLRRHTQSVNTPPEDAEPCCPSGYWIGIVGREGGELGVVGLESGVVHVMCLDNLSVTASLKWRGIRLGPGLGGEAGIEIIFFKGPTFPCLLEDQVANIMGGLGFDLSAGASLSDYLRGLASAGEQLPRALEGASGAQGKFDALADFLKGSGSGVKDELLQRAAAGGDSLASGGFTGLTFPLVGIGLNLGLWWTVCETCELISWQGCEACD